MNKKNGVFIVLEGPDGAGTTRHSEWLAENLSRAGHDVLLTSEPTNDPIGKQIRAKLKSDTKLEPAEIQELFVKDRAHHVEHIILPALAEGKIVITDRYALSTIIYGTAQGLDEAWLRELNKDFPTPALTIITLPPFEVCRERVLGREQRDQMEEDSLQRKVYSLYVAVDEPNTFFVDTSKEKEIASQQVFITAQKFL